MMKVCSNSLQKKNILNAVEQYMIDKSLKRTFKNRKLKIINRLNVRKPVLPAYLLTLYSN